VASAKEIVIKPITSAAANEVVKRIHYSGKVVQNSQLHFGVFLDDRLEGAMQFGPSLHKSKIQGLVSGTGWNDFIELNRMAFSEALPRNSESRAMAVAFRLIKRHYPHIKWVVSFSDGTQSGDGAIYRATGFVLTGITENKQILEFPDETRITSMVLTTHWQTETVIALCGRLGVPVKPRGVPEWRALGGVELPGYQLRYIYFLDPACRGRLTVPVLPFSKIADMDASMYRGKKLRRVKKQDSEHPSELGGAVPTDTLQLSPEAKSHVAN